MACDDVRAMRRVAVYPGTERYRIDRLTEVMPLSTILKEVGGT